MTKAKISVEAMMEAGMHFGHQTHRRNPKMDPYIFDARSGIHIIDLTKTEPLLKKALEFIETIVADGKQVILVGTKRQAAAIVKKHAEKCGMPYVDVRWLGGLLTNFHTIKKRLDYLKKLDIKYQQDDFAGMIKKEKVTLDKRYRSLQSSLGGLRSLEGLPGAVFVVDAIKDRIAVREARKLNIPVVAIVDTNVDPDLIDYIIPANDDAKKAIEYVVKLVAEACLAKPKTASKPATASSEVPPKAMIKAGRPTSKKEDSKATVTAGAEIKLKKKKSDD